MMVKKEELSRSPYKETVVDSRTQAVNSELEHEGETPGQQTTQGEPGATDHDLSQAIEQGTGSNVNWAKEGNVDNDQGA